MFRIFIAVVMLASSLASPVFAQQAVTPDNSLNNSPNKSAFTQNYVVSVHGIVCEFCSYGVAKKLRKLDFIDPAQLDKGVKVEIANQLVFIAVREEAELNKQALYKAIESGGYQPVTLWRIDSSGERVVVE